MGKVAKRGRPKNVEVVTPTVIIAHEEQREPEDNRRRSVESMSLHDIIGETVIRKCNTEIDLGGSRNRLEEMRTELQRVLDQINSQIELHDRMIQDLRVHTKRFE